MRHNPNDTPVIPDPVPPAPQGENVDQADARLGLTAPRVTLADLNAAIVDVEYVCHVAKSGQVLRWAVLTLANGFAHAGDPSASVSPENDSQELGEKYALENARRSLWPLLGYALKDRLHVDAAVASATPAPVDPAALRESLALGNTVAGFLGWLSADIPELRHVEVPRLAESYDRFLDRVAEERASGEGMPENSLRELTDAEHGRLGHEWHAESGRWLVPPVSKAGDTVNVRVPRSQE